MKKIILNLIVAAISYVGTAQIEAPVPSPLQKIEQKVGLTDISITYSRPSMKGRKIFGGLESYGKIWRTGANENTKISFSTNISIDGKELKKGTYALFTIPGKEAWDIILYTDTNNWGVPREWDPTKVAVQFRVTPLQMPMPIETLTITFDDLTYNSAVIGILWENTYVGLPFGTPTDAMVSKNIDQVMAGPTAQDFYTAADYYLSTNKDIQIAQKWIDKAVALSADQPRFWFLRKQALIHAKAGNLKTAIAAAKASLKYATRAKNDAYIEMNKASLKEWEGQ